MNYARRPGIDSGALSKLAAREEESFRSTHRESARLAQLSAAHWLGGVPMHWMRDWNTPHPLFVRRAKGVEVEDVDGNHYIDFCLGDTGAMFGHSPPAIARALAEAGAAGITAMLPAERVARVGEKLAGLFGLPFWQVTQTATDANRAALRWARAITGRSRILAFDGCYHGTVDETLVRAVPELKDKGGTRARAGLIGMSHDVSAATDAVPFNDIGGGRKSAGARPHRRGDCRAGDDQHRHGVARGRIPASACASSRGDMAHCSSLTRPTRCRARAAVMHARGTWSPTSGCAARRSQAACPARCSDSRPMSRKACGAYRATVPAVIRGWAPRCRPMRWRSPAWKPASTR